MSEPDELAALAEKWSGIVDPHILGPAAALARRRRQRTLVVGELLVAALMLALAAGFWLAGDGPVYRVAAALFVATAVLTVAFAARGRARLGRWDAWTPKGIVEFRLRECELAVAYAKWQLGGCALLIAFAVFVWVGAELQWDVLPRGFHYVYAASVAVAVVIVGVWAVRRTKAKEAERERLWALLDQMRED